MKSLALFPGQGSQKVGMGQQLFEQSPIAREIFSIADSRLRFALSKICFEGPIEKLTSTEVAQPAILTVSVICYKLFEQQTAQSAKVVAAAGHSLGEYSALVAAGAISFEDAVYTVHKRGAYMQQAVPAGVGSMYAILGKEVSEIEAALAKVQSGVAQIANINAPGQVVIAGNKSAVTEALSNLGSAKAIELPVSAPFHCALMQPAADALKKDLAALTISTAKFPVYANYSAKALTNPDEIREALYQQVCGRVRWVECMDHAIQETGATQVIEFGHGAVLNGMMKRINPGIARVSVDSVENCKLS